MSRAEPAGIVFNIQRASFHDGPGVRTTVFLKGCPLRCPWCHNPEGISPAPQVLRSDRCLDCGACTAACPRPGGPLPPGGEMGGAGCRACDRCLDACPTGARQRAGRAWRPDELLEELRRDRLVHESSGGGVTFSGGEPLAQPEFLLACLAACRRAGARTAVDTCGVAPRRVVLAVAAAADLLLWDVKHADPQRHLELTGAPLEPVLDNLRAAVAAGARIWLRVPLVPGVNEQPDTMRALGAVIAGIPGIERVTLLPYHRTGTGKRARLGLAPDVRPIPSPEEPMIAAAAGALAAAGLTVTVGG